MSSSRSLFDTSGPVGRDLMRYCSPLPPPVACLSFAAPEVLKGARYSGREQDVWALGVLGYVLICGEFAELIIPGATSRI